MFASLPVNRPTLIFLFKEEQPMIDTDFVQTDLSQLDKKALGALVVAATPAQISQNLNGEEVILHLDHGQYYGLTEVGTHVWQMIQEPKTVTEIKQNILKIYDVSDEVCEKDLLQLLQDLLDHELIEINNGGLAYA
jgi:Coenzyme PQQ synthesis protein D (PqqD)